MGIYVFGTFLKRDKGILDLVDAFLKINNRKNALLYLVGDDERKFGKKLKIKFKNFLSFTIIDQENIIQVCDTFCLPSYREGFGSSVIEACSHKKPIISK